MAKKKADPSMIEKIRECNRVHKAVMKDPNRKKRRHQ